MRIRACTRCSLFSRNELDKAGWNREPYSQMGFKEELDQRYEILEPKIASENVKDNFMISKIGD